jgi:hypothetical protein
MENALMLIVTVASFGLVAVVLPAMLSAYYRYRKGTVVTCPQGQQRAELTLDLGRAALSAAFGKPALRVTGCSLWPRKQDCHDQCLQDENSRAL